MFTYEVGFSVQGSAEGRVLGYPTNSTLTGCW
jgi:hypothetical protein